MYAYNTYMYSFQVDVLAQNLTNVTIDKEILKNQLKEDFNNSNRTEFENDVSMPSLEVL